MYDTDTKTLILDNVVIDDASREWGITVKDEGTTIKLIGKNSIRAKNGILAEGSFSIEGTEGSTLCIDVMEKGIAARDSMTVSDSRIQIHSREQAMIVEKTLALRNADIEIEAGTYTVNGMYALSCEKLDISNSSVLNVTARSNWPALYISEKASVKNSAMNITSTASAGISGKELNITGSSLNASGKGRGWPTMYLSGKVTISDSKGRIESDASNGIYCKELTILHSDLHICTKKTGGCCIYTWGDISVQGGTLETEDGSMRSEGRITIDGVVKKTG